MTLTNSVRHLRPHNLSSSSAHRNSFASCHSNQHIRPSSLLFSFFSTSHPPSPRLPRCSSRHPFKPISACSYRQHRFVLSEYHRRLLALHIATYSSSTQRQGFSTSTLRHQHQPSTSLTLKTVASGACCGSRGIAFDRSVQPRTSLRTSLASEKSEISSSSINTICIAYSRSVSSRQHRAPLVQRNRLLLSGPVRQHRQPAPAFDCLHSVHSTSQIACSSSFRCHCTRRSTYRQLILVDNSISYRQSLHKLFAQCS